MDTLRSLGYEYRDGKLLQVGSDQGFQFKDQDHYDRLANAVLEFVSTQLVEQGHLEELRVPLAASEGEATCPIYVSPDLGSCKKVLVIIQGSGRVRVGVWGCALCINKDLDQGTMLPHLRAAAQHGYGVIVCNPNENAVDGKHIRGSSTAEDHVAYVWEHIVTARCAAAETVDILAHSNGGRALLSFLGRVRGSDSGAAVAANAEQRIRHIVLTDSFHSPHDLRELSPAAQQMLADPSRTVNYVPHHTPLGTPVANWVSLGHNFSQATRGCPCVSAAVEDHAATNFASLSATFDFFSA
jgi:hypothetical protein